MRVIREALQGEVWDDWQHGEPDRWQFRSDIRDALPPDLVWHLCEVQLADVDLLFIISSEDWSDISGGTFRVTDVEARMDLQSSNDATMGIANAIRHKVRLLASGTHFHSHMIAITDSPLLIGPFTVIEGNHRSVALLRRKALAGSRVFLGYSPAVTGCWWARHTYRQGPLGARMYT